MFPARTVAHGTVAVGVGVRVGVVVCVYVGVGVAVRQSVVRICKPQAFSDPTSRRAASEITSDHVPALASPLKVARVPAPTPPGRYVPPGTGGQEYPISNSAASSSDMSEKPWEVRQTRPIR